MPEIIEQLNNGAAWWIAIGTAILSLIQIAPIKVNPWSFIATGIGRALNKEIFDRLDRNDSLLNELKNDVNDVRKDIDNLDNKIEMDAAITARVRILRFNDELLLNIDHTKDSFDQVLTDIDTYEDYCVRHPKFKNNQTVMTIVNIRNVYKNRLEKHDFLNWE